MAAIVALQKEIMAAVKPKQSHLKAIIAIAQKEFAVQRFPDRVMWLLLQIGSIAFLQVRFLQTRLFVDLLNFEALFLLRFLQIIQFRSKQLRTAQICLLLAIAAAFHSLLVKITAINWQISCHLMVSSVDSFRQTLKHFAVRTNC